MIEVYKEQVDKLCKELDALLSADGAEKAPEKIKELERLLKIVKVEARSSVEVKNKYKNWILEKEQQFEEYRRNVLLNTKGMSEGTANVSLFMFCFYNWYRYLSQYIFGIWNMHQ
uniref:Vesicle transport v-SNARE N-terminal domain-containing protein n=1 Tax=Aplanochytrium stocchinoi TaxID=215587 RepID=A0A7S3PP51_9STRA